MENQDQNFIKEKEGQRAKFLGIEKSRWEVEIFLKAIMDWEISGEFCKEGPHAGFLVDYPK